MVGNQWPVTGWGAVRPLSTEQNGRTDARLRRSAVRSVPPPAPAPAWFGRAVSSPPRDA